LRKLQEERATLTRFDDELRELESVIKEKKQAASDAELAAKRMEHEVQALGKEKTTAQTFVSNLEKQFEWIAEENQCVSCSCLTRAGFILMTYILVYLGSRAPSTILARWTWRR